ncbi:7-cyano-7-deazaguanine synthase [Kordiimonas lipolytica]|uniref:7-cyano-7-deazaguanine synthase n=1 Tax=Kordiimonas lipolytica TaxID=1662421 RepID=A0ABV8U9T9_9PROT|nr:7-cyano-7-deazaguanine synthase [Kordiimonas lipolytica]
MKRKALILLSGGVDSFVSADFMRKQNRDISCLFVDYGQPSAGQERKAANDVSAFLGVTLHKVNVAGIAIPNQGEIPARNMALISIACMYSMAAYHEIVMGIHGGVSYYDCSEDFFIKIRSLIMEISLGKTSFVAPLLKWDKSEIFNYCIHQNIPIELTYSCEIGADVPCGKCLSCKDRGMLGEGGKA